MLLRRRWWSSTRNVSTSTWICPLNDDTLPLEAEAPNPHDGLMIGGHVGVVGLLLVPHHHKVQTSLVSGERARFVSTTKDMAQLLGIVTTGIVGKRRGRTVDLATVLGNTRPWSRPFF